MPKQFTVISYPSPLHIQERDNFYMPVGSTLEDCLTEMCSRNPDKARFMGTIALGLEDVWLDPQKLAFHLIKPKADTRVVIVSVPAKSFGSLLLTFGTFILSSYIPAIGPVIAGVNLGTFAIRAALTIGAQLLSNALFGPSVPSLASNGKDNELAQSVITASSNSASLYGHIPKLYGRLPSYYPPLGALPYTETVGSVQRLRQLFVIGYGSLELSEFKIGETVIEDFEGQVTWSNGNWSLGQPTQLYPNQVREEGLSIRLSFADSWHVRRTQPNTDEVSLDVQFPQGLIRLSDRNKKFSVRVNFEVEYREVGTSTWVKPTLQQISDSTSIVGPGAFYVQRQAKTAFRRGIAFDLPSRSQYDIRLRRVTIDDQSDTEGDNQSNTSEESWWVALRSVTNDAPIMFDRNLALVAMRLQANERLNGVVEQFNCTVQAKLRTWNGSAWTAPVITRNPAWAFVDILTSEANAQPINDSLLDTTRIKEWADSNDTNERYYDAELRSGSTVFERLQQVTRQGRASFLFRDGLYSIAEDKPRNGELDIAGTFGPRNSRNYSATHSLINTPHAIQVRYPDATEQRQVVEREVFDDGFNDANATRFEVIDMPYTTEWQQAWKDARYFLAVSRLRRESHSIDVGIESVRLNRGDFIAVTRPIIGHAIADARIIDTIESGGTITEILVDNAFPMEVDGEYAIRVMNGSGQTSTHGIVTNAGIQYALTLSSPVSIVGDHPEPGTHVIFGTAVSTSVIGLVTGIRRNSDNTATITYQDEAPAVYTADTGVIPLFDPQITKPPQISRTPPAARILGIESDEWVMVVADNGSLLPRIGLGLGVASAGSTTAPATHFIVEFRPYVDSNEWTRLPVIPVTTDIVYIADVDEGDTYQIRVRTYSELMPGAVSEWVNAIHTVIGRTTPPPDVQGFYREGNNVSWVYNNPPPDVTHGGGFEIRKQAGTSRAWESAAIIHTGIVVGTQYNIESHLGEGTATFLIKAVDQAGIYSENASALTVNLGDADVENVILTQDEHADGFTGEKTTSTVDGITGDLEGDVSGTDPFWEADTIAFWGGGADDFWPTNTYYDLQYIATYQPIADHLGATIKLNLTTLGNEYSVEIRITRSEAFWGLDADDFWGLDADDFWGVSDQTDWTPWWGAVGPIDDTITDIEFRVSVLGGDIQPKITEMQIIIDVPDIVEFFNDVSIGSSGTRLTLTQTYRAITNVIVTLQDDGGSADNILVVDKDEALGPLIQTRQGATLVTGTIDAQVKGY